MKRGKVYLIVKKHNSNLKFSKSSLKVGNNISTSTHFEPICTRVLHRIFSDKKNVKLQNFRFFLSSTLIISMNAYIKETHIFYQMKYDLKGHIRSNEAFYVYSFSSPMFFQNCVRASQPDSN